MDDLYWVLYWKYGARKKIMGILNKVDELRRMPQITTETNFNYNPPRHHTLMKRQKLPNSFKIGGSKK